MQRAPSPRERRRNLLSACAAAAAILAALMLGQAATAPGFSPWYAALRQPSFTPPNGLLAPLWTVLYGLMGISLWRLLRLPESDLRRRALRCFGAQLVLNVAWSWLFFELHAVRIALVDLYLQLLALLLTIQACFALDAVAAWLLSPLLAWVAFTSALNLAIWRLNA